MAGSCNTVMNLRLYTMWGVSWLSQNLLAYPKGVCSMGWGPSERNSVALLPCQTSWRLGLLNIGGLSDYKHSFPHSILLLLPFRRKQTDLKGGQGTMSPTRTVCRSPRIYMKLKISGSEEAGQYLHSRPNRCNLQRKLSLSGIRQSCWVGKREHLTVPPRQRQL